MTETICRDQSAPSRQFNRIIPHTAAKAIPGYAVHSWLPVKVAIWEKRKQLPLGGYGEAGVCSYKNALGFDIVLRFLTSAKQRQQRVTELTAHHAVYLVSFRPVTRGPGGDRAEERLENEGRCVSGSDLMKHLSDWKLMGLSLGNATDSIRWILSTSCRRRL